ncbi:MAG: FHA domain-containing protein [Calditrichaeota bacterium]|nr:MAG: FHA domain-containing protein [Calditrichota bacterium]
MESDSKQLCRICQYENRPQNNFCTRCGTSLNASNEGEPRLVYVGNDGNENFSLTRRENRIGRDLSNEIVIHDAQISKRHAVIIRDGDHYFIEDTGSKNGIFVDGKRIQDRKIIENGCLLKLGSTFLKFESA